MVNDLIKSQAPGKCMNNWEASESDSSRRDYFHEVYDKVVIPVVLPLTQPELWYRPGWQPCKRLHITGSRRARREVYSRNLRKWHWRVAGEQLIFSHVDRVDHWDNTSKPRYELNVVNHLLIGSAAGQLRRVEHLRRDEEAGRGDDGDTRNRPLPLEHRSLRPLRAAPVPGPRDRRLPAVGRLADAEAVESAEPGDHRRLPRHRLFFRRKPRYGRILAVPRHEPHRWPSPFAFTTAECVDFIDHGCDVYVVRDDGKQTPCARGENGPRPHIASAPDASGGNNLYALAPQI